ncbi:hypothetical protein PR048_000463 [Dryococelus australis]|uniref:Uncharacterized protein n=1 Tax=Dryococelus australis TaxID=614101 RepID=A0ABQ9IEP5_9NEOP|nr:hypothetical protein PR048_000463 [Dryococelus australis]
MMPNFKQWVINITIWTNNNYVTERSKASQKAMSDGGIRLMTSCKVKCSFIMEGTPEKRDGQPIAQETIVMKAIEVAANLVFQENTVYRNEKQWLSVVWLTVLADGKKLPTYIIWKRKTMPREKPPNVNLRVQENGWSIPWYLTGLSVCGAGDQEHYWATEACSSEMTMM